MNYHIFNTKYGYAAIITNEDRLYRFMLPVETYEELESIAGRYGNKSEESPAIVESLRAYFEGEKVCFECEYDFDGKSEFDIKVWKAAIDIPYGHIVTYAFLASKVGHPNASRAVGNALGRNPLPVIIPCHRILRSDNKLGGFSAGLEWKTRLLGIENPNYIKII